MTIGGMTIQLVPKLLVSDADAAIAFYTAALDARVDLRVADDQGVVSHAELAIGSVAFALAGSVAEWGWNDPRSVGGSPVLIILTVPNPDATAERMVELGADLVIPVDDRPYGKRQGRVQDPFGHLWVVDGELRETSRCPTGMLHSHAKVEDGSSSAAAHDRSPRCRRHGVRRACTSKWVNRSRRDGELGLLDCLSVPRGQPTATPGSVVARIETLPRSHKWSTSRLAFGLESDDIIINITQKCASRIDPPVLSYRRAPWRKLPIKPRGGRRGEHGYVIIRHAGSGMRPRIHSTP